MITSKLSLPVSSPSCLTFNMTLKKLLDFTTALHMLYQSSSCLRHGTSLAKLFLRKAMEKNTHAMKKEVEGEAVSKCG